MDSNNNRPVEVFVRKRVDEDAIDNAEDDRRSADTECQGEDGDEGETTIMAEVAEGTSEVARQTIQVGFHTSKLYTEAAADCRDLASSTAASQTASVMP